MPPDLQKVRMRTADIFVLMQRSTRLREFVTATCEISIPVQLLL